MVALAAVTIVGSGSVGRAIGGGLAAVGHAVTYAVRDTADARHADLPRVAPIGEAARGADVVVLAVPADAVAATVPALGLAPGQVVLDATNAVRTPVPDGFATLGAFVASLVPAGVHVAKAFNTVGVEHLRGGRTPQGGVFLPVAGDAEAVAAALTLADELGYDAVSLGGPERIAMVEDHARLWIHLAFACGWGRGFAFTVARG